MTHKNGTSYTEEFKQQIVYLYNVGTLAAKLADENSLIEQTIYKWIKYYSLIIIKDDETTVSMKEYKVLQKKILQFEIENENEILKKATAIFQRKQ